MRNSAWYTKLWRKKLSELPVKGDEGLAWAKMKDLLDQQMPAGIPVPHPVATSTLTKLLSKLGYLFSAVAILGTAYFFLEMREPFGGKEQRFEEQKKEEQRFEEQRFRSKEQKSKEQINALALEEQKKEEQRFEEQRFRSKEQKSKEQINALALEDQRSEEQKIEDQGKQEQRFEDQRSKEKKSKEQISEIDKIKEQRAGAEGTIDSISRYKIHERALSSSKTNRSGFIVAHPVSKRNMSGSFNMQNGNILEIPLEKLNPVPTLMTPYTERNDRNDHFNSISSLFIWQKPSPIQTQKPGKKNVKSKRDTNRAKTSALSKDNRAALLDQKKKSSIKKPKLPLSTPTYNYGLKSGVSTGFGNNSVYFGVYGAYKLKTRWIVNVGLNLNTFRSISGEYLHASYYRPDSLPAFKIIDKRRLLVMDIPITAEYRLSKAISVKAGPVISLPVLQSGITHSFGMIVDTRDTVYHSKQIDSAINKTAINKVNLGFTGGISIQVRKFNVDVMYQFLKPYKISNELGGYQKKYQTIQFGVGYRFK